MALRSLCRLPKSDLPRRCNGVALFVLPKEAANLGGLRWNNANGRGVMGNMDPLLTRLFILVPLVGLLVGLGWLSWLLATD